MESLKSVAYKLDEETRMESILVCGETFSEHITSEGEVVITDHINNSKIYAVMSKDFYSLLTNDR